MRGLLTDLYELTMAAGYFQAGKTREIASFELFIRSLPPNRNFILAAGLPQVADYLLGVRFEAEDIEYLRRLPQFARAPAGFFEALREFRFTGDHYAVPEGTPIFPGEPILTVRAPLSEAQIVETYLLATIAFQSMVATKAARIVRAARGRAVIEFGTRRAHSPEAGVLASRAAYIGGCAGTSNTLAGRLYGIPVYGTAAHSWVQSFADEMESYRELQKLLGPETVYLIDTYDTLAGARKAVSLGPPLWGVRLDSGNVAELARGVRELLDNAGLHEARIFATGDLNEYKIRQLTNADVPIDAFGVGTELATSADAPSLGAVYKLVEIETAAGIRYTAKFSQEKSTLPGAKQIYRFRDCDLLALATEPPPPEREGAVPEALLELVIAGGKLVKAIPDATAARSYASDCLKKLPESVQRLQAPEPYPVEYSQALENLYEQARKENGGGA